MVVVLTAVYFIPVARKLQVVGIDGVSVRWQKMLIFQMSLSLEQPES